jgi:hypothetical protein
MQAARAIGEAPPHDSFHLEAFNELSSSRSVGMGVGPIPTTAILDYARHLRLTERETDDFWFIIRAVDRQFLSVIMPMVQKRNQPPSS